MVGDRDFYLFWFWFLIKNKGNKGVLWDFLVISLYNRVGIVSYMIYLFIKIYVKNLVYSSFWLIVFIGIL